MAAEVARLARRPPPGQAGRRAAGRLLAMAGHEDGILAYAADPDAAGRALLAALED
jgi:hypothetical protein